MTEISVYSVQMTITPKVGKPELWFLCSVHHLMVLYISVKFHVNISNSFQVMEQKQFYDRHTCVHSVTTLKQHACEILYIKLPQFNITVFPHGKNNNK